MRIGIMLRTLDEKGGIGVYTRYLLEALLAIDAHNEYVLFYQNPGNLGRFANCPNVTERVVHAYSKALWDQLSIPYACWRERVDMLLHPKFTLPLLGRAPCVMVLHGADWFLPEAAHFYKRLDRAYIRVFMPLYLRRASVVLSVSGLTTTHFNRIFALPPGKVRTVYFGPAPHFRRVDDPGILRTVKERYGLPDRFLLTLSRYDGGERKNIGGVLHTYAQLHGRIPHKLVVGGLRCERFRTDYDIPDEGWGHDVIFPGWIDQRDLPAVYTLSDLFLYPSNQEAFPIPLTEAMACGTPIVTSRANGLEEIAGDAALLVDPTNSFEAADAVLRVLWDDEVRARLVNAGLERTRLFSWESCAQQTLAVLEEVGGVETGRVRADVHPLEPKGGKDPS